MKLYAIHSRNCCRRELNIEFMCCGAGAHREESQTELAQVEGGNATEHHR